MFTLNDYLSAKAKHTSLLPSRDVSDLKIKSTLRTAIPVKAFLGQMVCDSQENLYLRTFDGQFLSQEKTLRAPIQQLERNGTITKQFAVSEAGSELGAGPFFVAVDGQVSQIAWAAGQKRLQLIVFSRNGDLTEKVEIESEIEPYQVARYRSGEILLTGLEFKADMNKPFTGLFSPNGKLIREISFAEDHQLEDSATRGDEDFTSPNSPYQGNLAVEYGDIAAGTDGNIYLMRRTSPTLIYAISRSGRIIRHLSINPQQADFLPVTMKAARGKLAILYESKHRTERFIMVTDFRGKELKRYTVSNMLGAGLGCYASPDFLFVTSAQGFINVYRTVPN